MKNVLKVTALSLGLALSAGFANSAENIAFINAGYLFQNHPDRQLIADKLDAEFKTKADQLKESKKSIDNKIAALQKDAKNPKSRPSELKKREDEVNKLMRAHDEKVQKFQMENEKRQAEERAKILESIQSVTNDLAKAKGYTYVLDANSVVFAAEGKDITEDVLKAIPAGKTAEKTEKPAETTEKK